jgi:hypothetical protein
MPSASLALALAATLLVIAPATRAASIVYTLTGTFSGSLGGTPFTDAAVTLTVVADTSGIVSGHVVYTGGEAPFYTNPGTATIDIAGVGTATLTGPDTFGVAAHDASILIPGLGVVAVIDVPLLVGIAGLYFTLPPFYDLGSAVTLTGSTWASTDPFPTTLGTLQLESATGSGTFTAVLVPEPAQWAVLGVFLCGAMVAVRRLRA